MNPLVYTDLNIPIGPNCKRVCETAISYGYKVLAINTPVLAKNCCEGQQQGKKSGKKRKWEERSGGIMASTAASIGKSQVGIPPPTTAEWEVKLMTENPGVRILKRLTIIFSEITELQRAFILPNVKLYDILAVIPTSHTVLESCIINAAFVFDIISFDLEGPHWIKSVRLNKLKGDAASRRDIFFEITYASSMHGDQSLENMVYLAKHLTEDICIKKIKNMIVSSGAASPLELRAPKDSTSLAFLLGLTETSARQCIRENGVRVLDKSDARRNGKTWAAFIPGETSQKFDERPQLLEEMDEDSPLGDVTP